MDLVNPSGAPPNPNLDGLAAELTAMTGAPPPGDAATSAPIPPPEPAPIEPPPEPPDPRASRRYASRAVNLSHRDARLEGTFYEMNGNLHPAYLEGTFGAHTFDSLNDLFAAVEHTPEQRGHLLDRLHNLLIQPKRF